MAGGSPGAALRLGRVLSLAWLVTVACKAPAAPAPARPPAPDAGAAASRPPAPDDPIAEPRAALASLADAICACTDGVCAHPPLNAHLLWEGKLLLLDGTERGRALIAAVKSDPGMQGLEARIEQCKKRLRAVPPDAERAARAWLEAVRRKDEAALVAASAPRLRVSGWSGPGCAADQRAAGVAALRVVASCVVDTPLHRDLSQFLEGRGGDSLSAELVGTRVGWDLPRWADEEFDALGRDQTLLSIGFFGGELYHELLFAVTADGKVSAALVSSQVPE